MNKSYGGRVPGLAIGITLLGLLLAGIANAATLTVCESGCAYSSIQAAIDTSSSGDTVQVQSGTYYENVNVNKQLTLRGIGMPVVDASGSGSVITLSADGIRLEGFTVNGSGDFPEAGINVASNNSILSGNNASNNYYCIYLDYSSNNTLSDNTASNSYYGIRLSDSSNNNTIYNNYFSNTKNAFDDGNNLWNIPKTSGTNIINGAFSGGNFWNDYAGNDTDGDGLGDTMLPYNSSGGIANGGDYRPLIHIISPDPGAPDIASFNPPTPTVTNKVSESRIFNITANQTVNVTWFINGTKVFNETDVTASSYINTSAAGGAWNVTATASNANGTTSLEWTWIVTENLKGDLNGNGQLADAGDLVLMKRASIGEISADSRYDLNNNGQFADAGDLVLMKRASIGEINL